jgi:hypothetical protein
MSAPFYVYGAFGETTSLFVAVAIGIGFGFFLERAGFGSARKLVSQFYLDDMAVFKVMFSAILTAMVGLALLGRFGLVDLDGIGLVSTALWPEAVGGLLLGAGFVIGGYCPGTSVAAIATGKLDGLSFALGLLGGTALFAVAFPALEGFYAMGERGALTLPEVFGLSKGLVVAAVLAVALAGFWAAGRIEARFSRASQ